ncbi:MAG: hypothetical protein QXL14_03330 [Candidatus Aenigmatarchaeota archaeon]
MKRNAIIVNEQVFNKIKEFRDFLLIEKKMRFKNYSEFFEWLIDQAKEKVTKVTAGVNNERSDNIL